MDSFDVTGPELVAETGIAKVWRVKRANGEDAALKIYDDLDMQDEAPGLDYLEAQNGIGAVKIFARADGAVLMEWLGGSSLGDMVRQGEDARTARELAHVACALHSAPAQTIRSLDP